MIKRDFWIRRLEAAWRTAPIVWLAGVRRVGKTILAESLDEGRTEYFDCERPALDEMSKDPDLFFKSRSKPLIVLDEIHRLRDPSRLLKIGADHYPQFKILATGSSTLAASDLFKDTLSGRKQTVHLVPVLWTELESFDVSLEKRLTHGGLPPALLAPKKEAGWYREWMDSFFARDIQRLFRFRDIEKFQLFLEYVLKQSSGLFEISQASRDLGISRPTVESHLRALTVTQAITVVRPFHGGGNSELVRRPKVYGFDTGFVSFCRGWDPPRPSDFGALWEHMVLEFLRAIRPEHPIFYWRDGSDREVDFVLVQDRDTVDAIECKWNPDQFDPAALRAFRTAYPQGKNYLVTPRGGPFYDRSYKGMTVRVCNPSALPGSFHP